jgi:hypothetical protein
MWNPKPFQPILSLYGQKCRLHSDENCIFCAEAEPLLFVNNTSMVSWSFSDGSLSSSSRAAPKHHRRRRRRCRCVLLLLLPLALKGSFLMQWDIRKARLIPCCHRLFASLATAHTKSSMPVCQCKISVWEKRFLSSLDAPRRGSKTAGYKKIQATPKTMSV